MPQKPKHKPVLLPQVLELLDPHLGESYLDGTAGYGGHATAVLDRLGPKGRAVLVDRDSNAIQALSEAFAKDNRVRIIHANFTTAAASLEAEGDHFETILLDLGVASPQLDIPERGFSFGRDGPLDMRMDQSQDLTAERVVNTYSQERLERIIREFGEERFARRVARAIVEDRPFRSTKQLADMIGRVVKTSGDIHPATRTFQAFRIEVNAELESLEEVLPAFVRLLDPGGRLAVISFHSLEDRIVKNFFDRESRDCICPPKQPICTCDHVATLVKLTRRPIQGATEDVSNPRARSAKLRAVAKNKNNKEGGPK